MAKQNAKAIECESTLIEEILELTDKTNTLATQHKEAKTLLKEKTQQLSNESREIFDADMGDFGEGKVPQVFGNHEYTAGQRVVNVNYKMATGGFTITNIDEQPACKIIPQHIGEDQYKKLFKEEEIILDDRDKLREVHKYNPDLVGVSLVGALPDHELEALAKQYPDAFSFYIKDEDKYKATISDAQVAIEVSTGPSFIGKVAKLPESILSGDIKDFFRKIFRDKVVSAVKCGNRVS